MSNTLPRLLADLKKDNSMKAWSLIITFLGDSIAPRGGAVSAATIQSAMALCGIGSGTVRTALSRLGKDGWVEREKSGRNSFYRLSPKAASESLAASKLIYARPPHANSAQPPLRIAVLPPGVKIPTQTSAVKLLDHVYLLAENYPRIEALLAMQCLTARLDNLNLPDWAEAAILPAPLRDKFKKLQLRAEEIAQCNTYVAEDAMALRTILIHEWRRLLLRLDWPCEAICPAVQQNTHRIVASLYRKLSPGTDTWLQKHGIGPNGALPQPEKEVQDRFR